MPEAVQCCGRARGPIGMLFASYVTSLHATAGGPGPHDLYDIRSVFIETLLLLSSSFAFGMASLALKYAAFYRRSSTSCLCMGCTSPAGASGWSGAPRPALLCLGPEARGPATDPVFSVAADHRGGRHGMDHGKPGSAHGNAAAAVKGTIRPAIW